MKLVRVLAATLSGRRWTSAGFFAVPPAESSASSGEPQRMQWTWIVKNTEDCLFIES